ncbi:MAG: pyridoxamine 5'-phosphate oxidase family protein, partial [Clostridia bacterium]|nr:pyridoxamine 5'-phosphate oxidase family protein [Clostridia bacterium]
MASTPWLLRARMANLVAFLASDRSSSIHDVTINVAGGKIYFHSAVVGHKIDALRACDKVCFTVVDADEVVAEKFTTYYRSVIVFGRARILTDPADLRS